MTDIKIGDRVLVLAATFAAQCVGQSGVVESIDDTYQIAGMDHRFYVRLDDSRLNGNGTVHASAIHRLNPPSRWDGPRQRAATAAKAILGDTADVYDIVTLAEFLLGVGPAVPTPMPTDIDDAAVAPRPKPFRFTDPDQDRIEVDRFGPDVLIRLVGPNRGEVAVHMGAEQIADLAAFLAYPVPA